MKSEKVKAAIERYRHTFAGFARPEEIAGYSRLFAEAAEMAEEEVEERVRAELTRWHDPKAELPPFQMEVLVKFSSGDYAVAWRWAHPTLGDGWTTDGIGVMVESSNPVIGWREIHE